MRKSTLRALAASLLLASSAWASAEEIVISPYFEGFEKATYSKPIPLTWYHLLDPSGISVDYYNNTYTGHEIEGRTEKCCIRVGEQSYEDYYEPEYSYDLDDFLIPPRVKGEVSFWLKKYGSVADITVYKFTREADGTFTKGEQVTLEGTLPSNTSTWAEFKFTLDDFTYIGLKVDNCYLDSFSATEAIEDEIPAMSLSQFSLNGVEAFYADENGHTTITASIKVTNEGNCLLAPGDPRFSLTIRNGSSQNSPEICQVALDQELPVGEMKEYTIEIPYTLDDPLVHNNNLTLYAFENAGNTTSYAVYPRVRAYIPELEVYDSELNSSGQPGQYTITNLNLGLFQGVKTAGFTLANKGGAPLTVTEMTLPDGVACITQLPVTMEAGQRCPVELTFTGPEGTISGTIGFISNASEDNAASKKSITYSGAIAGEGSFMEDFEAEDYGKIPNGWVTSGSQWAFYITSATPSNGYAQDNEYSEQSTLATPLIEFGENGKITFALAKTSSYGTSYVKVYTSPDRITWTEIGEINKNSNDIYSAASIYDYNYFSVNVPAGQHYIGFRGEAIYLDNVFGGKRVNVTDDLFLSAYKLPSSGAVNSPMEFSVSLRNLAAQDVEEYTVSILDGENVLKTIDPAELPVLSATDATPVVIATTYTPHEAGMKSLTVKVELPSGYSVSTPVAEVNVAEEVFSADVMVGTVTASESSNSNQVPFSFYDKNSISEFIYTADVLPIEAGAKINSISFPFHYPSGKIATKHITIWLENTADADVTVSNSRVGNDVLADAETMTKVHEGDHEFIEGCEGELVYNDKFGIVTFTFSQEFVYSGENIRMIIDNYGAEAYVSGTGFATFEGTTGAFYANDNIPNYLNIELKRCTSMPVAILGINAQAPTLTGTVTIDGSGDPLAGALVKFTSGDVFYQTETADDGAFSIEILKPDLSYNGLVAASSYIDHAIDPQIYGEDISLGAISLTSNEIDATSFIATVDETAEGVINLVWEPVVPGSVDAFVDYTVTLDGQSVIENLTETEYQLTGVAEGDHTVGVCANFRPSGLASQFVTAQAVLSSINGVSIDGQGLVLSGRTVIVNAAEAGVVSVFNAAGQCVRTVTVAAGVSTFTLDPGTYLINFNGKTVKAAVR